MYNYIDAMKDDIKFVSQDYEWGDKLKASNFDEDCASEIRDKMYDDLFNDDSVTGNGSGSYTFNRDLAREYVTDNMDLAKEACTEFCVEADSIAEKFLNEDWEWFDVIIRCYLLGTAIDEFLDELFG